MPALYYFFAALALIFAVGAYVRKRIYRKRVAAAHERQRILSFLSAISDQNSQDKFFYLRDKEGKLPWKYVEAFQPRVDEVLGKRAVRLNFCFRREKEIINEGHSGTLSGDALLTQMEHIQSEIDAAKSNFWSCGVSVACALGFKVKNRYADYLPSEEPVAEQLIRR
jgi:hypothetical protein